MTGALYMGKCHHNYFMNCSWSFCLYAALMTWSLLFTEGLVNAWRALNSRTAPVLSNFFLKRLSALSIDSFSLMLIMIIAVHLLSDCKCTANLFNCKAKSKNWSTANGQQSTAHLIGPQLLFSLVTSTKADLQILSMLGSQKIRLSLSGQPNFKYLYFRESIWWCQNQCLKSATICRGLSTVVCWLKTVNSLHQSAVDRRLWTVD